MMTYGDMEKALGLHVTNLGPCESCMGGPNCGTCEKWLREINREIYSCQDGESYTNKTECEALLKYWNDKEGSADEWRMNNVPMKKWNDDGLMCESCMGDVLDCKPWIKSIGLKWCGERTKAYANKAQTEALLKWHNDRYGSIEQARRDSEKEKAKYIFGGFKDFDADGWLEHIRAEFKPKEVIETIVDVFNVNSETMDRILKSYLVQKEETPKPFATLEEFDLKIIKMFIERRKIKFRQLCLGLGLEREDVNRIIEGIK